MKKQIALAIAIFIIGILIGCGMMSVILKFPNRCDEVKTKCPKQEMEKEDDCIKPDTPPLTPEEPEVDEKPLEIDDIVKDVTLNPTEEDVYSLLSASNSSMSISDDMLGIMYTEKDLSDFISLYVTNHLFTIATELDYEKVVMNNNSKISIKRTTLEKLSKKLYTNYHIPNKKIEVYYEGVSNIECDETNCVFDWELWGYVGPVGSHYISKESDIKKSGNNKIITKEIIYLDLEVKEELSSEEIKENLILKKRAESPTGKDLGIIEQIKDFDYYKKQLGSCEKYQYTIDKDNRLVSVKKLA